MSGIAAIFHADGRPVEPGMIERMTSAMAYRGPDAIRHWTAGSSAIGHCLLQTTDADAPGSQPLADDDAGLVVAMDGYLANYAELREDLLARGARLRSSSDAELVLHAYEAWGADCPAHLDGEYGFVVHDRRKARLFCARDHVGLRPLHYHWDGKTLLVASDVAAILAALPQAPDIDRGFLAEVSTHRWLSQDRTGWSEIARLLPAHSLDCAASGKPRLREYWQLPTGVSINYSSDEEYAEHYLEVLSTSIARAARTSSPLACEVSGGLDSSAVFALAREMQAAGTLPAPDLRGYTFLPPSGSGADELDYVTDLEQWLGVQLERAELFMPPLDWFWQQAREDRDLASYPNTVMMMNLGAQLVADGCRVVLNGQGGDLWLNGTPYGYHQELAAGRLGNLWRLFAADRQAFGMSEAVRMLARYGVKPALPLGARGVMRAVRRRVADTPTICEEEVFWLAPDLRAVLLARQVAKAQADWADPHAYKREKLRYPLYLRVFDSFTRQAARQGYEARSPMLSREFIEFSAMTPERIRMQGGVTKRIHRQALSGRIPPSIRDRNSKAEFSVVYDHLAQDIRNYLESGSLSGNRALFDRPGLKRFAKKYCGAAIDKSMTWEIFGLIASNHFATLACADGVFDDDN